jgi:hypothetical protein
VLGDRQDASDPLDIDGVLAVNAGDVNVLSD